MCFAFCFIAENDFFSCLGFVFMQSFRLYHLFPFASRWEWMKCGIFCLCFFAWRLFRLVQSACCGFSSLLFFKKTHVMCFSACFFSQKHTFLLCTCRLASGLCFLARFPSKKHTPCVFPLTSSLKNTLFSYVRVD